MRMALGLATQALDTGDVPVGALVLAPDGLPLAGACNRRQALADPTGHAEILALRAAGDALGTWRLDGCTLVATLEPCTMCAGALVLSRVARLVFGAWDPKAGAAGSVRDVVRDARLNHRVEVVGGVLEAECGDLLRTFFDAHRPLRDLADRPWSDPREPPLYDLPDRAP
ncbi:MAG: tRNA adenosine(34) deaminase TadA [Kineosporiaceae bacterium]